MLTCRVNVIVSILVEHCSNYSTKLEEEHDEVENTIYMNNWWGDLKLN